MGTTVATSTPRRVMAGAVVLLSMILSLGITTVVIGSRRFGRLVRRDTDKLLAESSAAPQVVVTEEMLEGLPSPVQRYLRYAGIVGKPMARIIHVKQKGTMQPSAKGGRIPLEAEQWYTVQPPGFVWDGMMHVGPLPVARARDEYFNGRGNMLVRAGATFTVVDSKGEEMDQGEMMRYLSEMIWFPSAFLLDTISFEPVDDASARVTLTNGGRSVTGTMYFDQEGRLTNFVAERYRMVGGAYELCTWSTPTTEYGVLAGLNLPVRGKAVWNLPDGDLEYIDATISALEYDAPE